MTIEIALPWQVAAVWGQILSGRLEQFRPYPMDNWGTGRDELANAFITPMGQLWEVMNEEQRREVMGFPGDREFAVLCNLGDILAEHINEKGRLPKATKSIVLQCLTRFWGEK